MDVKIKLPLKKPKTPTEATAEKAYYKLCKKLIAGQEEKKKQKEKQREDFLYA